MVRLQILVPIEQTRTISHQKIQQTFRIEEKRVGQETKTNNVGSIRNKKVSVTG